LRPNNSTRRSLAILNVPRIVAAVITHASSIIVAMTNDTRFPSPSPMLAVVSSAIAALQQTE
jgi:hypothetical protein